MEKTVPLNHAKLGQAIEAMSLAEVKLGLHEAGKRLAPLARRYRRGLLRVLVVGEIKKGKSSMINALLGHPELVPTSADVATSTVFKIMHGLAVRHRAYFMVPPGGGEAPPPRDLMPKEVATYGTEAGNPGNEKGVDFIGVECPHPLLAAGLVLIDLPGLGGVYRAHSRLTLEYLPKADAVLFVVDSTESMLGRTEVETLGKMRAGRVAFVQTKIDLADEVHWRSWRERNLQIIQRELGTSRAASCYFAVSSRLKEMADEDRSTKDAVASGYPELAGFLSGELLPSKQDALGAPLALAIAAEAEAAAPVLRERLAIVTTEGAEQLRDLEGKLRQRQLEYRDWREKSLPAIYGELEHGLDVARSRASARMRAELTPGTTGPVVGRLMREIEAEGVSADDIAHLAPRIVDATIEACGEKLLSIGAEYDKAAGEAYRRAAGEVGQAITQPVVQMTRPSIAIDEGSASLHVRGSSFDHARAGFLSGSFGGMAAGVLASLAFPPAGLVVLASSVVGTVFGWVKGFTDAREQQRRAVLAELRGILADVVHRLQGEAASVMDEHARNTRSAMQKALRGALDERDREIQAAIAETEAQRQRGREETAAAARAVREQITMLERTSHLAREAAPPVRRAA